MYADEKPIVLNPFMEAWKATPLLTVSEWSDQNRILSRKAASEPGRWRTERTPYLKEIMDVLSVTHPSKEIVFMKGSQIGGPLHLDTLVPTPSGFKKIRDISIGDKVFNENGKQQNVLGVSDVFQNEHCYEVYFNDGTIVKCDGRHLWGVQALEGKKFYTVTRRTEEMFFDFKKGNRNKYKIPVSGPIETSSKELIIGPYTLGAWLGDGNRNSNRITTHTDDIEEMRTEIESEGHKTSTLKSSVHKNVCEIIIDPLKDSEYCIRGHELKASGKTSNGKCRACHNYRSYQSQYGGPKLVPVLKFGGKIRQLNLYKNKHIPMQYLRASKKQRLRLLQGLMDTDGYCSKSGTCEFYTVDKTLAEQVLHLISSLGIKASHFTKPPNKNSTYGGSKNVNVIRFRPYWGIKVFCLKRKQSRLKPIGNRKEALSRYITEIKKVKGHPTVCIQVDSPNNLFLIEKSCIATHNTECGNNWIGYIIDHVPAPIMLVQPNIETAKRNSNTRIAPLLEECPSLAAKVPSGKSREKGNTALQKDFPGGILVMTGANSAAGLRSIPIRFLFLDEVDAYPKDVDGEGDPIALAEARTRTFSRRKIFKVSTPTIKDDSSIEREFEHSDQRFYYVPCPHCGHYQTLIFKNLKWDGNNHKTASYYCEGCGEEIKEHHKTTMLERGEWRAHNQESDVVGFHINALYSPLGWFSWADVAEEFLKAKGNREAMKAFVNTILGETYEDSGDAPEWKKLYMRRSEYDLGAIQEKTLFLTMAVDVQKNRLEWEVKGWGRKKENWSVDFGIIEGMTNEGHVWQELDKQINNIYQHPNGHQMPIIITAIDSGYETQKVYEFVRNYHPKRVVAVKGRDELQTVLAMPRGVDIRENGKVVKRNATMLWGYGSSIIKSEIYGWLNSDQPASDELMPIGFSHFPMYDEEYFKQLTAEQLTKKKTTRGYFKHEWVKKRDRNEALDLFVMNRAAASIVGIDRFGEKDWAKYEKNLKVVKPLKKDENKDAIIKRRQKSKGTFW